MAMEAVMQANCRAGFGLCHLRVHRTHRRDSDQHSYILGNLPSREKVVKEKCQVRVLGYEQRWWLSSLREGNVLEGCWRLAGSV